jgi:hypothetical protein
MDSYTEKLKERQRFKMELAAAMRGHGTAEDEIDAAVDLFDAAFWLGVDAGGTLYCESLPWPFRLIGRWWVSLHLKTKQNR